MGKKTRELAVSCTYVHDVVVPRIRVQGQWLGKAGFHAGDTVTIEVDHERLLITRKRENGHGVNYPTAEET